MQIPPVKRVSQRIVPFDTVFHMFSLGLLFNILLHIVFDIGIGPAICPGLCTFMNHVYKLPRSSWQRPGLTSCSKDLASLVGLASPLANIFPFISFFLCVCYGPCPLA